MSTVYVWQEDWDSFQEFSTVPSSGGEIPKIALNVRKDWQSLCSVQLLQSGSPKGEADAPEPQALPITAHIQGDLRDLTAT